MNAHVNLAQNFPTFVTLFAIVVPPVVPCNRLCPSDDLADGVAGQSAGVSNRVTLKKESKLENPTSIGYVPRCNLRGFKQR